jgi:hypothetical protein
MTTKFTVSTSETAIGTAHSFKGPGMPQYANSVHFIQPLNEWAEKCCEPKEALDGRPMKDVEAETILRLLRAAYDAGFSDAKAELRGWLGVSSK